ncbi:MAG: hypothetical protein ACXVHC_05735, partial [Frankiaceae bacterium]
MILGIGEALLRPRHEHLRGAGRAHSLHRVGSFCCVTIVGATHDDYRVLGVRAGCGDLRRAGQRPRIDVRDPARGEQVGDEAGASVVLGDRPERGQQRRRTGAGGRQVRVGPVPQPFERLCVPDDRELACVCPCSTGRGPILVQVGELV